MTDYKQTELRTARRKGLDTDLSWLVVDKTDCVVGGIDKTGTHVTIQCLDDLIKYYRVSEDYEDSSIDLLHTFSKMKFPTDISKDDSVRKKYDAGYSYSQKKFKTRIHKKSIVTKRDKKRKKLMRVRESTDS